MTVPEATDTTVHIATADYRAGYYRAVCSCGKYRSRRYALIAHARRAFAAHLRAVTAPHGCIRPKDVAT